MAETYLQAHQTEVAFPGMVLEWYFDKQIVVYSLSTVNRESLREWSELVLKTICEWPTERPYLAMHDFSHPSASLQYATMTNFEMSNVGILPAQSSQVHDLLNLRSTRGNRVSMTFNLALSGRVAKTLADTHWSSIQDIPVEYRAFYDRIAAIGWLALSIGNKIPMVANV